MNSQNNSARNISNPYAGLNVPRSYIPTPHQSMLDYGFPTDAFYNASPQMVMMDKWPIQMQLLANQYPNVLSFRFRKCFYLLICREGSDNLCSGSIQSIPVISGQWEWACPSFQHQFDKFQDRDFLA